VRRSHGPPNLSLGTRRPPWRRLEAEGPASEAGVAVIAAAAVAIVAVVCSQESRGGGKGRHGIDPFMRSKNLHFVLATKINCMH